MYKILITDDEEKIRALIKKYAIFEGHTAVEAPTLTVNKSKSS